VAVGWFAESCHKQRTTSAVESPMNKQALVVIDMQQGLFSEDTPRHDAAGLVRRLNRLAARLRDRGAPIVFIRHCGPDGDNLHPSQPGHAFHSDLEVTSDDIIIAKRSCDAFLGTELQNILTDQGIRRLIITGCATDFCVDTTVRGALARGYETVVPVDGHTTADRPHLSATKIIEHHNAIWADFISPVGPAQLAHCGDL
jgi:nicotinamidase-related amidase